MANQMVSLSQASPYDVRAEELDRRQRLADLMQQQAYQPIEAQSYNGIQAPISPLQGLAKMLQAYNGAEQGRKVADERKALVREASQARSKAYSDVLAGMNAKPWTNPETGEVSSAPAGGNAGLIAALINSDQPDLQKLGIQQKLAMDIKAMPGKTNTPSTVAEWEYFTRLPKEDQERFLLMKRANPYINLGGSMAQPSQTNPGRLNAEIPKTVSPDALPETRGAQTAAVERAKNTVEAQKEAPTIEANAAQVTKLVDDILTHPAFTEVIGAPESVSGGLAKMGVTVPGSKAAGLMGLLDQLQGQQFLQAFESLKGGGQITEVEGRKATDAISRLQKTGMPEEEYRKAAAEFKEVVAAALARSKARSAGGAQTPTNVAPPAGQPTPPSGLTPEEDAELKALRARFGR